MTHDTAAHQDRSAPHADSPEASPEVRAAAESMRRLVDAVGSVVVGQHAMVERLLIGMLTGGHVLLEGVPGLAKTLTVSALAGAIDGEFSRIQFTPDLLPADLVGTLIFNPRESTFSTRKGPVFANIVLADEINRTTPRTQTALLEAMSDGSVSIDGTVHMLPPPFIVLATQNPYEFEGTYLLPENQLDRFLMRISLGYPSPEREATLLDVRPAQTVLDGLAPVLSAADIVELQAQVDKVKLSEPIREYIVRFARATREHESFEIGLSPRGSLALAHAARATAAMDGRDHVVPEDVIENIIPVCAHRVFLRGDSGFSNWNAAASVLEETLRTVGSPV